MDNVNISKILELYSDDSNNTDCVVGIDFLEGLSDRVIKIIERFINS